MIKIPSVAEFEEKAAKIYKQIAYEDSSHAILTIAAALLRSYRDGGDMVYQDTLQTLALSQAVIKDIQ